MSEKDLLPLHRIDSNSARNVAQYLRKKWIPCFIYTGCALFITLFWFGPFSKHIRDPIVGHFTFTAPTVQITQGVWDGWENLDKIFAFGDSYTSMDFEVDGPQPSLTNPFGNPAAEGSKGRPKVGPAGPLWIHYATMEYNETIVRTYDFARGGSTIDRDIIGPVWPTASTFKDEVDHKFLPNYAAKYNTPDWIASSTLFTTWFGINDILISYHDLERSPNERLVEEYAAGVLSLFHSGARNFLMINIPPFDRTLHTGKPGLLELAADIADFNTRLSDMRTSLMAKYDSLNIFYLDAHALYQSVIANPAAYPQSAQLRDTSHPCKAYDLGIGYNGTVDTGRFDSRCAYGADQYFWGDDVHPTLAVHNVTAAVIVEDCMGPNGRKGFCS